MSTGGSKYGLLIAMLVTFAGFWAFEAADVSSDNKSIMFWILLGVFVVLTIVRVILSRSGRG